VLIAEKTGCEQATQSTLGNVFCRCMVPNVRCQSGFVWLGEILRRRIAGKANVLCCLNSPAKSSGPWMAERARTCLAPLKELDRSSSDVKTTLIVGVAEYCRQRLPAAAVCWREPRQ
jgi:hypothetical protein